MPDDANGSKAAADALPRLIAFDLDYTLWDLWVDTHVSPPIRRKGDEMNTVVDRRGTSFGFYKDVPSILFGLRDSNVQVAACSRTHAPEAARQTLQGLFIEPSSAGSAEGGPETPTPAIKLFQHLEIFPGSKMTHFRNLHKTTGIPYTEMLFFDDEARNREVASLGVTFILVPEGVNRRIFEKGLAIWREARSSNGNVERLDRSARV